MLICSDIEVESDTPDLTLDAYETVREKNIVYILVNKEINKLSDLLEEDDFCDAVSEIVLNTFKIVDNEIEMKIKMLLSKRDKRKKRFLKDEGEDAMSRLEECKSLLGLILTSKTSFWETIFDIKDKSLSEDVKTDEELLQKVKENILPISDDLWNKIDYDNYSNPDNYAFIKELFSLLKISLVDFNTRSSFKKIDFSNYLKLELKKFFTSYEKNFRSSLFNKFKVDLNKQKQFIKIMSDYDNLELEINKETFINVSEYFYDLVSKQFGISKNEIEDAETIDLGKIYSQNRAKIVEELQSKRFDENEILTFLNSLNAEDDSLIYFGNLSGLINEFVSTHKPTEKIVSKEKEKTREEKLNDELKKIEEEVKNNPPDIEKVEPLRPKEVEPDKEIKRIRSTSHKNRVSDIEKEEIGLIGEKVLYERLKIEYGEDFVGWVSLNAKKAGINPSGNDSNGYDIYYKKDGKIKYIEVKSSKNEVTSFNISKYEIEFGEKNKEDYEVWLILNCMNRDERKIINLGTIFKYHSKEESFNNNLNFSVENDNFVISFVLDKD